MIRKGKKTLKTPPEPLISRGGWWAVYAIFSFSFVLRAFRLTKPKELSLGEIELFNNFEIFTRGHAPLDTKPLSGRFLLFFPYYLLTNNDFKKLDTFLPYLRLMSAILGSFANSFITAAILVNKYSMISAISAGLFLAIDGSLIIVTKLYTTDSLFMFFASLVILLCAISARRPRNSLVIQGMCFFASLATCTDQIGFIMVLYVMIMCRGQRMKTIGTALSLFFLFGTAEISIKALFSVEISNDYPDASFTDQIVQTIKRMKLLNVIPTNYESMLYWSLIKLRPVNLWKADDSRIAAVYNIPVVLFVSLSAFFGILNKSSWFFWMSIVAVWALKKVTIIDYSLPLLFGVLALVEAFESLHEVIRSMSLVVMITVAFMFFFVFFPWIYGIVVGNGEYDNDIDIWNH